MGGLNISDWSELADAATGLRDRSITGLFADKGRAAAFSAQALGLFFDFSKTNLDAGALDLLFSLYDRADVARRRDAMFAGEKVNETEGRAVLHTALRSPSREILVDGENVIPGIHATLTRMEAFANDLRSGAFVGAGGAITDIVNIGIGGSDLGPAMAVLALAPYHDGPRCHFVSNVDGAHIADTLKGLDPGRTLVIVASKTFTTIETMTNAQTARKWMAQSVADPGAQFAALSSATDKTADFGIAPERVFGFEDWVGGRYSVWGPIGLSLMLAIGPENFRRFLAGGAEMDSHFQTAPMRENLPVLLALIGIWHNQGMGYGTRAVLPYEQRLSRLPAYLQQLEMESNGKSVSMDGQRLAVNSGPVVWGEPGTNGQHAFYQLIHQGTRVVPCEFLVGAKGHEADLADHHALLVANCLAQSQALMKGRNLAEARKIMEDRSLEDPELDRQARHRVFPGNRPSTTLIYPLLTPRVLGQIIALYEHRVFVEGAMLGINSFDQWGVELGKELATALAPVVRGEATAKGKDGSTQALVRFVRDHQS